MFLGYDAPELKAELKRLIEKERSQKKLAAIRGLLMREGGNNAADQGMMAMALGSEEDIKVGRGRPWSEVHEELGAYIKKLYKSPKSVKGNSGPRKPAAR